MHAVDTRPYCMTFWYCDLVPYLERITIRRLRVNRSDIDIMRFQEYACHERSLITASVEGKQLNHRQPRSPIRAERATLCQAVRPVLLRY